MPGVGRTCLSSVSCRPGKSAHQVRRQHSADPPVRPAAGWPERDQRERPDVTRLMSYDTAVLLTFGLRRSRTQTCGNGHTAKDGALEDGRGHVGAGVELGVASPAVRGAIYGPRPAVPLTERIFARLPGPRLVWVIAWALVPWLNLAVIVAFGAGEWPQRGVPLSEVLNRTAVTFAVLLSLCGVRRGSLTSFGRWDLPWRMWSSRTSQMWSGSSMGSTASWFRCC
jgi:hypothetical protein